jgi:ABC-type Fe3+-hydroxamate transport system substrate-binding protein
MNPDFIILSDGGLTRPEAIKQILSDASWKYLTAVKNQKFIFVNQAKLTSVSHHVLDAIKSIHYQLLGS